MGGDAVTYMLAHVSMRQPACALSANRGPTAREAEDHNNPADTSTLNTLHLTRLNSCS